MDGEPEAISALAANADGSLVVAGGKLGTISIGKIQTREKGAASALANCREAEIRISSRCV